MNRVTLGSKRSCGVFSLKFATSNDVMVLTNYSCQIVGFHTLEVLRFRLKDLSR
jgi:hypothetical protein